MQRTVLYIGCRPPAELIKGDRWSLDCFCNLGIIADKIAKFEGTNSLHGYISIVAYLTLRKCVLKSLERQHRFTVHAGIPGIPTFELEDVSEFLTGWVIYMMVDQRLPARLRGRYYITAHGRHILSLQQSYRAWDWNVIRLRFRTFGGMKQTSKFNKNFFKSLEQSGRFRRELADTSSGDTVY